MKNKVLFESSRNKKNKNKYDPLAVKDEWLINFIEGMEGSEKNINIMIVGFILD
jgi:hypothetical protein